ncbi:SPOR domain-containing protein [Luteimonas sp. S4-F44]|uniref:SPOR domain-containing protein n=1 Tax=Luteimonas sp. S4-F44 TaxID=2925842 RepID=UPI001F52F94C|nr:SPOR domain-containing protein [Luteimonas sp. S4-F44]UNK41969.1 SPOR domain-containing protein [Luteimonas sp. S4-F44]
MLLRAIALLLVILNLGVAAWWALRDTPAESPPLPAETAPTLTLLPPQAAPPAPMPLAEAFESEETAALDGDSDGDAVVEPRCVALGPFADAAARDAARQRLAGDGVRVSAREVAVAPRGWRVWLPPQRDRAAADAMAARLRAAGIEDQYVIADGNDAYGIALGRFDSEAPARARVETLRVAGFTVQAEPIGGQVQLWLDALVDAATADAALRTRTGAPRAEPGHCATTQDAG